MSTCTSQIRNKSMSALLQGLSEVNVPKEDISFPLMIDEARWKYN